MRVRAIGVLTTVSAVVCVLLGMGSGSATARGAGVACGPTQAKTLASDSEARVYSRNGGVYGCARSGHRSFRLGTDAKAASSEGRPGPIALAGPYAAYGLGYYGVDTVSYEVVVRNLTNGHVLRRRAAYTGTIGPEYFENVTDIVVKRDGSVAWIATAGSIISGRVSNSEVEKADRNAGTLLDRGAQIRPHSLKLSGSRLTWRDGRATRRATLK